MRDAVILSPSFGRRISRNASDFHSAGVALRPKTWIFRERAIQAAIKSEIFREILRPKEELRMTVFQSCFLTIGNDGEKPSVASYFTRSPDIPCPVTAPTLTRIH